MLIVGGREHGESFHSINGVKVADEDRARDVGGWDECHCGRTYPTDWGALCFINVCET